MRWRILFLIACFSPASLLAQTLTFPAEETNNIFTGTNTFQGDLSTHLINYTVAQLPAPATVMTGLIVIVTDATSSGTCTPGGGAIASLCRNSGAAWIPIGGSSGGASLSTDNTFTNNNRFKGPIPWRDITAFGARAVNLPIPTATASCTSGLATVSLNAASTFQNGDGVVINGCGLTPSMATPNAPSVSPGQSQSLTVPESSLASYTGATGYNYLLVAHDQAGGFSLPSSITALATGTSTLGQQTFTVTSESLVGSVLTVVTSAMNNLVVNTLIHVSGSTNAALSGWFNVSSITNGTTFVVKNLPIYSATTVASTGGTLVYYIGNKLTWAASAGAWEYYVCASRPADSGAYHIIGISYPFSANGNGSTAYTDWGSVLSSAPLLPSYVTDAICTNGAVTNDYLSSTIVSGGGSTNLTLANNASQSTSGKTINFDDAPAILAAAVAAHGGSNAGGTTVLIPPDPGPSFGYFVVSSFLNLNLGGAGVSIHQQGNVIVYDTIEAPVKWQGDPISNGSQNQFSLNSTTTISCQTAWPCMYVPSLGTNDIEYLTFNSAAQNQSLQVMWDTSSLEGGKFQHVTMSTCGCATDFSGISLVVRPAGFVIDLKDLSFLPGPGQSFMDQTWTPTMWIMHSTTGIGAVQSYVINDVTSSARGVYATSYGNGTGPAYFHNLYIQGTIMPALTVQNFNGTTGAAMDLSLIHNDTSPQPLLAILGGSSSVNADITFTLSNAGSNEAGGIPPFITGTAPTRMLMIGDYVDTPAPTTKIPITYVNTISLLQRAYYANDALDTGTESFSLTKPRGIQQNTFPITTLSGMFVPLATPIMSSVVVSAGGTDIIGANKYCVVAVGWNGGWSQASCLTATTTTGNQTVQPSWASVPGAQGYVVIENGTKCIPAGNQDCTGISTASTTLTYSGGAGCCYNPPVPTASADGTQGFNASGLFGSQIALYPTTVAGLPAAGVSNASQWRTVKNSTAVAAEGQTCVDAGGGGVVAAAFSNGTVWKCF